MSLLDIRKLTSFLKLAGERLSGDWVLIGGTVLPALNEEYRATTDIDVVGLNNPDQAATLQLMDIASELELPVESINQAGAYFLMKIPDFEKHLVLLHQGKRASIYRPDVLLYIQLKVGRLTETDLSDCLQYIRVAATRKESWDIKAARKLLTQAIKNEGPGERLNRLRKLDSAIARCR